MRRAFATSWTVVPHNSTQLCSDVGDSRPSNHTWYRATKHVYGALDTLYPQVPAVPSNDEQDSGGTVSPPAKQHVRALQKNKNRVSMATPTSKGGGRK